MASAHQYPYPTTLSTERLTLRLNDPSNDTDCLLVISVYQDPAAGLGGNSRVGINTIADVQKKHLTHGAKTKPRLCTRVSPNHVPEGIFFLTYLRDTGEFIGFVGMSFRPEMPYPDFGYALFRPFWSNGYAAEAGREGLRWWRDVIGVREVWLGTVDANSRSQRTAERIGFVKGGVVDIVFGADGSNGGKTKMTGTAYVLPGMEWKEEDENGVRYEVKATVGEETQEQMISEIRVG